MKKSFHTFVYADCFQKLLPLLYNAYNQSINDIENLLLTDPFIALLEKGDLFSATLSPYEILQRCQIKDALNLKNDPFPLHDDISEASPISWAGNVLGLGLGEYEMTLSDMLSKHSLHELTNDAYWRLHNDSDNSIMKELFECPPRWIPPSAYERVELPVPVAEKFLNLLNIGDIQFEKAYLTGIVHSIGFTHGYMPLNETINFNVLPGYIDIKEEALLKLAQKNSWNTIASPIIEKHKLLCCPMTIPPFDVPKECLSASELDIVSTYLPKLILTTEPLPGRARKLAADIASAEKDKFEAYEESCHINSCIRILLEHKKTICEDVSNIIQ